MNDTNSTYQNITCGGGYNNFSHTSTKGFLQKKRVRNDEIGVSAGGKFDKSLRWSLSNADCKHYYKRDEHKETMNTKT